MNMCVYVYKGLLLCSCLLELKLVCLNILAICLSFICACSMLFVLSNCLHNIICCLCLYDLWTLIDMGFLDVSSLNLDYAIKVSLG